MIGKIRKGKGFAGLTKYILEKEAAELICTNLAGETPQNFYRQMEATRLLNPRIESPVSHISISFALGERPEKERLQQIVEGTLWGMKFNKCLYFAATHDDCDHFHLHIAASRINLDGECVSDWWDKRRLEKVLRNLETQFDLTPVASSRDVEHTAPSTGQKRRMMREQRNFELRLRDKPAEKSAAEKIQQAIDATIQPGITMTQFLEQLETVGIETKVKVSQEGIIQGISYFTDGVAFSGRKLGRNAKACTFTGILARGVEFDWNQDTVALTHRATSHSPQEKQTINPALIVKNQSYPQNLSLLAEESQISNITSNSQGPSVCDSMDSQQNFMVESKMHPPKRQKSTDLTL